MEQSKLEKVESIFKIIAVIIAGIWSIYIFRYQNVILPSKEPVDVTIKTDFIKMVTVNKMSYFLLKFDVKNESKITDVLPITYFNVFGSKVVGYDSNENYKYNPIVKNDSFSTAELDKYSYISKGSSEYFECGKIFKENTILRPQSELISPFVVSFPTGKFNMIIVVYELYQTKEEVKVGVKWEKDSITNKINALVYRIGQDSTKISSHRGSFYSFVDSN